MKENLRGNSVCTSISLFVSYVKHFSQETTASVIIFSLVTLGGTSNRPRRVPHRTYKLRHFGRCVYICI